LRLESSACSVVTKTTATTTAIVTTVAEADVNVNTVNLDVDATVQAAVGSQLYLPKDLAMCCGTIQLVALGTWLNQAGISFWNFGHPPRKRTMKYKRDLGGKVYTRKEFLTRWCAVRDNTPIDNNIIGEFDLQALTFCKGVT
jgi:hypothetical protein